LSENSKFVEELEKRNVTFIGPKATAMDALGDKIHSKKLAMNAGVNTVPGYLHDIPNADEAVKIARDIGYPVMVKASSGGGGKGMRVCYSEWDYFTLDGLASVVITEAA
jgi:propionyl-CoA carboxylase alpha chain